MGSKRGRLRKLEEAAAESRRTALTARRKLSAVDGSDEAARRATQEQVRSAF